MRQLVQLQDRLEAIKSANIKLVGISYDSVEILNKFAKQRDIEFPLLSDPGSKAIAAYGVLNEGAGGRARGVPYPGTFLIDDQGIVRGFLAGTTYQRHSPEELIDAVKKLR